MNISLQHYLQKLSGLASTPAFSTIELRYGEFTMYALIGPEENILHLTFAEEKHAAALGQLRSLGPGVCFTSLKQAEFPLDAFLRDYFHGRHARCPIKINSPFIDGASVFHKRVWQHISTIPYGTCITYRELAVMAGSPKGARAVGMACGANPLVVIIPCHRVVAVNGLGGFAGGTGIKRALLDLEGVSGYFREQADI